MSYLSLIPNLTIAVPKDTEELKRMLQFSATYSHPLAIRYPRSGKVLFSTKNTEIIPGKWEYLEKNEDANATIIATGERCLIIAMKVCENLKKSGINVDVVNARFVKPVDKELLQNLQTKNVITIEDNVFVGGLGSMVNGELIAMDKPCKIRNFAYKDEFIPQGKVGQLQSDYGVNCVEIETYLRGRLS